MNEVKLGSLIDGSQQRDAIHIAVAPVVAGEELRRGQGVTFESGSADVVRPSDTKAIGVVDPFLPRNVKKGERFYMLLNPYTITGLRHEWTHPAFPASTPRSEDDALIERIADECGKTVDALMGDATHFSSGGDGIMDNSERYKNVSSEDWERFWTIFHKRTGLVPIDRWAPYTCSC